MNEIAYLVDKDESEKLNLLVIKLTLAQRKDFSLKFASQTPTLSQWQKLATAKDKDPLKILQLKDVKYDQSSLKIPYSQSIQALKLLAASGKLFFQKKQLVCDFYTPVEFYYLVKDNSVTGMLKFSDQEYDLTTCDFICGGSAPWFIKGNMLKLIKTDVSWKDLKQLHKDKSYFSLGDLEAIEDVRIVHADQSLESLKQSQQPFPLLLLKDRSGAFADLWMDYGKGKLLAYHDPIVGQRDVLAEKNWEKDLLETGFIKKQVGESHYYCPLDQVAKSLSFLLEIGWTIQDHQRKKVTLLKDVKLEAYAQSQDIIVRGKLKFDHYEADLAQVAGAFNKRERFVQMGSETVGLLPDKWEKEDFSSLFEEGEIFTEGLKFKKHHIGSIEHLFKDVEKFSLDQSLSRFKTELQNLSEIPAVLPNSSFKGTLRPYQQQGVNWLNFLYQFGFHGILSDDMGLGKTVQVLAFLSLLNSNQPSLIVLPTSLLFNWKKEIERFLPSKKVLLHHGPSRIQSSEDLKNECLILTTYATLRLDLPFLQKVEFAAAILDEAQAIKNASTQAAQAVFKLNAKFRLLLTGTPIENHLGEIWSHFHFLMPDLLGEEKSFQADLQAAQSDSRYLQKIKKKIRPFILRRKKTEVAKDLPECIEQTVWVEMSPVQRQIYEGYLSGIKNNLFIKVTAEGLSKHRLEIFEAILRLRQICCHPLLISSQLPADTFYESAKLEALLQDLETAFEENSKVLIYSQFTSMLQLIAKEVQKRKWNYVYLDGSTKDRERVVNQFQDDPETSFFLISLKAGGTGLNLTAADHVLIFDPWWNEAAEKQAINRAHRIGRTSTVFAKRYAMVETIEEKMMKLKEKKRFMIESVLEDEEAFTQMTLDDFIYLLS